MNVSNNPASSLSFPFGDPDIMREAMSSMGTPTDVATDIASDVVTNVAEEASVGLSEIWEHLAGLFY